MICYNFAMKMNIFLSILFIFVTAFSAKHNIKHVYKQDITDCIACAIEKNLSSADFVCDVTNVKIIHFDKIVQNTFFIRFFNEKITTRNRAPPTYT